MHLDAVFAPDGLATRADLLAVMNPKTLTRHVRAGRIVRVWQGVYASTEPDLRTRLTGLELMAGRIPAAELRFFEGGHMFMLQDRAAVPAMIEFLNR